MAFIMVEGDGNTSVATAGSAGVEKCQHPDF
jgi:hypothetical protein